MEILTPKGFECVDLENVSFRDQVDMFVECSHFISIHGGALTKQLDLTLNMAQK